MFTCSKVINAFKRWPTHLAKALKLTFPKHAWLNSITQRFLFPVSTVSTRNARHNDPPLVYKKQQKTPGATSRKIGWGCITLPAESLTLFQTWSKIWYPISDLKPWSPAGDWSTWQGVTRLAQTIKLLVLSPNDEEPASSKKLTQIKTIEYTNHCRGQNTLQIMSLATDTSETNIKLTNSVTNQLRE